MTKKYPATFIGRVQKKYDDGWTTLSYKYRGEIYLVDVPHNEYTTATPMKIQHQQAQAAIDAKLDNPQEPEPELIKRNAADDGFDMFWKFVNGEVQ